MSSTIYCSSLVLTSRFARGSDSVALSLLLRSILSLFYRYLLEYSNLLLSIDTHTLDALIIFYDQVTILSHYVHSLGLASLYPIRGALNVIVIDHRVMLD